MPEFIVSVAKIGELYEAYKVTADNKEEAEELWNENGELISSWFKSRDMAIIDVEEN